MSPEQREFLNLEKAPARLSVEQTAWRLGFQMHDVPVLVAAGLLHTLGHPAANAPKYFAGSEVESLHNDRKWLARATDAIQNHWRRRNVQRKGTPAES